MSTFLAKADLLPLIKSHHLDQIIEDDDSILDQAEADAISEVRSYLFQLYDMDTELGNTGADRNAYLVTICKTITLYYIYQRVEHELIPDRVITNYEATVRKLDKVRDGEHALELARLTTTDSEGNDVPNKRFRWGSEAQRSHSDNT